MKQCGLLGLLIYLLFVPEVLAEPIHDAAKTGNLTIIKQLIKNGEDVNRNDENGVSALFLAAGHGHKDVVGLLLANKANPDQKTVQGATTSLIIASQAGNLESVEILLQYKASVNLQSDKGWTSLMGASQNGHSAVVKLLLDDGADPNIGDFENSRPLYFASQGGHLDVVHLLLTKGAEVNAGESGDVGVTALYIASQNGHLDVAKLLLDNGADPNIKRKNGFYPLRIAAEKGHFPLTNVLARQGMVFDPRTMSVIRLSSEILFMDSFGNITITFRPTREILPLPDAAASGALQEVIKLLDAGGDVNSIGQMSVFRISALMLASFNGHADVVRELLKHGAQVNAKAENDMDALKAAAYNGHIDVVKVLLRGGADPSVHGVIGAVPAIYLAEIRGHKEVEEFLRKWMDSHKSRRQ